MKSPFPYFGGKSRVAKLVWQRFGDVGNYVEPFAGSLAVLLARPHEPRTETVNDLDGFIANFWRAAKYDPEKVAHYADWQPNENDLHARHAWLVERRETLVAKLEGDPDYFDAKIAGWWVWGISLWIGSGWCSGSGPWQSVETEQGRQLLHLGDKGVGVHRQLLHLGNKGQGVHRQRLNISGPGRDIGTNSDLYGMMHELADRLRHVRVCSGDWSRICGPSPTYKLGLTGVFLDPPYATEAMRASGLYAKDDYDVAHDVRKWAIENGDNPLMRIALCGYESEHGAAMPGDWEVVAWKAGGGYAGQRKNETNDNGSNERIWFSPHCLKVDRIQQMEIF